AAGNVFDMAHVDADAAVLFGFDEAGERFAEQCHIGAVPDFHIAEFEDREAVIGDELQELLRHGVGEPCLVGSSVWGRAPTLSDVSHPPRQTAGRTTTA